MNRAQRRAQTSKKGGKYFGLNKNRQTQIGGITKPNDWESIIQKLSQTC